MGLAAAAGGSRKVGGAGCCSRGSRKVCGASCCSRGGGGGAILYLFSFPYVRTLPT